MLETARPAVLVEVVEALGSTPREAGASMLVAEDSTAGTIGGGALEFRAIEAAHAMLKDGRTAVELDLALGPALGQCCGGRVQLALRRADQATLATFQARTRDEQAQRPTVLIFGAGHTGRALVDALAPLPFRTRLIDTRPEMLGNLPVGVAASATVLPEAAVTDAPPGSAFLVMTHDHALDFLIAEAALNRGDAAYVGLIGSKTKREQFRRMLAGKGMEAAIERLTLPIGGSAVRDKRPAVIAALTAAELVTCLLSRQQENLTDRLAAQGPECNSASNGQTR
ncbi:xanthine dehydrogenase accessory protein XdhC [Consotaella aegiceratis]|uniref:xanthine dehydrogenase accessory protein XdhC n=1 Tax=Consotaella aegiceratis TaxID=3097961 RepID=UPI003D80955F